MGWRTVIGLAGVGLVGALVACQQPAQEDSAGDQAAVQQDPFDRNNVLDDKSLRDSAAMTAADVQKFLDVTPWGTKSALADYKEDGKTAAEIIVDAAKKHDINPIELLVRAQAEQGLIKKTTAKDTTIAIAFGCGCPDSAACSDSYRGLANQAECAAGTIDRSMSRATTSSGTVSGWAKQKQKSSLDGLVITPTNAATAAIYTYTPWVGEKGGGKVGVGGAYLHWDVWGSFAQYLNYGDWAQTPKDDQAQSGDGGNAGDNPQPADDAGAQAPDPNPDPGAGDPNPSAGDDAGPTGDGTATDPDAGAKDDGSDDGKILNGNAPPAVNAPPPGSHPRTSAAPNLPQELPQASEADLAGKPKTTGGCSTSGGTGDASLVGLGLAIALVVSRRRR